eukprot:1161364-Pelagomonas_calceolata.AAC.5
MQKQELDIVLNTSVDCARCVNNTARACMTAVCFGVAGIFTIKTYWTLEVLHSTAHQRLTDPQARERKSGSMDTAFLGL